MDLNKYINFKLMLTDLVKEHRDELEKNRDNVPNYDRLLKFIDTKIIDEFDVMVEECEFREDIINFVFGFDYNDANESNNQSTTANYLIVYDRRIELFVGCYYEAG